MWGPSFWHFSSKNYVGHRVYFCLKITKKQCKLISGFKQCRKVKAHISIALGKTVAALIFSVSIYETRCCCSSLSYVPLFATSWAAACQAPLSSSISWSLLKLECIKLVMPSNHLILDHPLLSLPSILPSISLFKKKRKMELICRTALRICDNVCRMPIIFYGTSFISLTKE